jgi:hypothetical protein
VTDYDRQVGIATLMNAEILGAPIGCAMGVSRS